MASSFGAASTTSMNNAGGSVATTSSSSLTSYSPISTLERQYNMGQRLMVFVSANAACCLEGGVESIIKLKGDQTGSLLSSDTVATPASFEETTDDDENGRILFPEEERKKTLGHEMQSQTNDSQGVDDAPDFSLSLALPNGQELGPASKIP